MPHPTADHRVAAWPVILGATVLSATAGQSPLLLALARRWQLLLTNNTGDAITGLRLRYRNRSGGAWSAWESVTDDIPLADAGTLRAVETDGAAYELDVEVTAAAAGTVALDLVGV